MFNHVGNAYSKYTFKFVFALHCNYVKNACEEKYQNTIVLSGWWNYVWLRVFFATF